MKPKEYLFTSKRLGFRNWRDSDLDDFAAMSADDDVMKYFPSTLSKEEARAKLLKMSEHFEKYGYTYYVVETLDLSEFVGIIGLGMQTYDTAFTPAVDIGWRLKKGAWGKGYATEGAKRCLDYAFGHLGLERIFAVCAIQNIKSEKVMKRIGMTKMGEFEHPDLRAYPKLARCHRYEIRSDQHLNNPDYPSET